MVLFCNFPQSFSQFKETKTEEKIKEECVFILEVFFKKHCLGEVAYSSEVSLILYVSNFKSELIAFEDEHKNRFYWFKNKLKSFIEFLEVQQKIIIKSNSNQEILSKSWIELREKTGEIIFKLKRFPKKSTFNQQKRGQI